MFKVVRSCVLMCHTDPMFKSSKFHIFLLSLAESLKVHTMKLALSGLVQTATFEAKRLVVFNIDWSITNNSTATLH